jgi:hypothetical protein
LPSFNSQTILRVFSRLGLIFALASIWLSVSPSVRAQQAIPSDTTKGKDALPARLGDKWRAAGEARTLSAEKFAVVQDADVLLEYGLQSVSARSYTNGKTSVLVEAFEMRYPSGAHGLFTFNRGSLSSGRQEFHAGRYLVSVTSARGAAVESAAMDELKRALERHLIEGEIELSPLPTHLPEQDKIADSEKYLIGPEALARIAAFSHLKGTIDFTGGAEAVTAEYNNGGGRMSLMIVEYHTPQLATDGYAQIKQHHDALSAQEQARRLVKRTGNYIIAAVNVGDLAAAQAIADQIKYTARVYWAGERFTAIPIEYRPPDPAILEEARRTAQFLTSTFYGIGLAMAGTFVLGVLTGGIFFYLRRYRRRKLGLDDVFSDAGGTVQLDIEGFLLPGDKSKVKLLGKND